MTQRRMFTRLAAALGAVAVAGALALPANAAGEEEETDEVVEDEGADPETYQDPNTLVISTSQSIENWNPFMQIYVIEHQFRQLQYQPLISLSAEDYTPTGGLAEDWEESEDGLTWTFNLRETNWHDGEPVTAEDVEYTYEILLTDPVISARNADLVDLIDEVVAVDESTVEIRVNRPTVTIENSDQVIVPKHIWEEYDGAWNEFTNDDFPIVGSGPFQMTDFETDQFIRYQANEDFWGGAPGFDELVFQYYTEPDTAVAALEAGEVDLVGGLNEQQLQRLEGIDGIETNVAPDRRWTALRFNTGSVTSGGEEFGNPNPALADTQVRQAIHHAIDKQELIDRVRGGYGVVATSIVPSVFETTHWEPSGDEVIGPDMDEANRLLDEAGYEMGDGGMRTTPDGDPFVLSFGVDAGTAERENAAQFIEEWLEEVGIDVETTISEDVQDMFDAGDIDMAFTGWGINPDPTYNFTRQSCSQLPLEPGGGTTDTFYCNEELDSIVREQAGETDPDTRAGLLTEAQSILYEESPIIFLWYPTVMEAYNTAKVEQFTTQPTDEGMIMGQIGSWAYASAEPVEGETTQQGASNTVLFIVIGVVVLALAILVVVILRRRSTAGDRE